MNIKVKVGTGGIITLNDKNYLAAGGQAKIYVNGGKAFKLYHDPVKTMLPISKINELGTIANPQVVIPQDVIYDKSGNPLGYTTKFIDNAEPLLKFFTRTFKDANNVSPDMINQLVKKMQLIAQDVHLAKCLIVDFNELNVLVNINSMLPWFIDTDSYATPSHKASAIMDSIRDRRVTKYDTNGKIEYHPDIMSDWYSFAILAFWLYSNIHPYRGNHNDYKPKDKAKQMDDGISVFHTGVRVPPNVNNFNIIPKRHLDWFKDVFLNNNRSVPPLPDSSSPVVVPTQIVIVKSSDKLAIIDISAYGSPVMNVIQSMGVNYVVTKASVFADKKQLVSCDTYNKVLLSPASDGTMIAGMLKGNQVLFRNASGTAPIGTMQSLNFFQRNKAFYTMSAGKLVENTFSTIGSKVVHKAIDIENVSLLSSKMYDGCVIQDLLGKTYLTIPYKQGSSFCKHVLELDKYRIVGAKSDKNVTVILGEHGGKYDRIIIVFKKDYQSFDIRIVHDVTYDTINLAVLENGICMLLASSTELELFIAANKYETIIDPPIDSSMKLFAIDNGFFFINGNSIHQLKKK